MALSSTTYRVAFSGNGSTTVFSFPYYFLLDADLVVILRVDSTGVETTKTITTHYTVSGAANPSGGSVTMLTAPATGETLIVYRDPALTQDLDITANDPLPAENLEKSLDRLTMIAQRLDGRMDRAVTLSEGTTDPFTATLPALLTDNPGATIVVNDDGDGWDVGPTADEITAAAGYATAAAASESAAAASAVLADASADAALVSETAAAASAASAAAQLASAFFRDVVYITSADSPRTITSSDNGKLFNINSSGGAISFTLPTIASTTLPFNVSFKLTTAGNTVTINRASTDTIEGATSATLSTAGQGLDLIADADGSPDNWSAIAVPGTVLPIANGGTGATTAAGAVNALIIAPSAVKTTTYAILTTDSAVLTDATSGSFTVTLPTAVGVAGKTYTIKRTDQTLANAVTIATTSSQTIDGATTRKLCTQYEQFTIVSDGSNWQVLSHTYPQIETSYTPSTNGLGTPSAVEVVWMRIGNVLRVRGNITAGTTTAAEARVNFPSGLTATAFSNIRMGGTCFPDNVDGGSNISILSVISEPSVSYFTFGFRNSSAAPLTKQLGNGIFTSSVRFTFEGSVPIANWEA